MRLQVSKSKNSTTYYVAKSFRNDMGKISSKIVERLGSIEELKAKAGNEDPIAWAKNDVKELSHQEKGGKSKSCGGIFHHTIAGSK